MKQKLLIGLLFVAMLIGFVLVAQQQTQTKPQQFDRKTIKMYNKDIRLSLYRQHGYSEEAYLDEYWLIRHECNIALGIRNIARKDSYWATRKLAFDAHGYTSEALNDPSPIIKNIAHALLQKKKAEEEAKAKMKKTQ